jgi:SAM-dependent MidA family methyltransferase
MSGPFLPWSEAMRHALYGPDGFYMTRGGPAAHFRTSVHASPLFAAAIVRLLRDTDALLGAPDEIAVVDVGAGRGELLDQVAALVADDPLAERVRLVAVEAAERPDSLAPAVDWRDALPDGRVTGLLVANEWLDNVPCDVVEATTEGWRIVEVSARGEERIGATPTPAQLEWLSAWWPMPEPLDESVPEFGRARAEVGLARDAAWRHAVSVVGRGIAVAIDYAHTRESRPPFGSLTGYARGRQTMPVPDGSCDITAHVALDACAAAARADWSIRSTQRAVFHSLGITGARPDLALASTDPRGYLRALSQASHAAELVAADGLGGFGWLVQGVGLPLPPALARVQGS